MRRKTEFANEEYYHIYNRGVDKREIFSCDKDYLRFLDNCRRFNGATPSTPGVENRPVDIIAYCLNPNHYHFIIKQLAKNGISEFMHQVNMGYSKYFNAKNDRSGFLFQGPFKSIHIDSNEYLLYLSAYVNMNHFIHGYKTYLTPGVVATPGVQEEGVRSAIENPWKYSSLPDYFGKRNGTPCNKAPILDQFRDIKDYEEFLIDNGLYLKGKKEMEKYILE